MERIIASSKEHLTKKATALPPSTSNKSREVAQKLGVGGTVLQDRFVVIQLYSRLFYWDILLNTEKFSSRFFRLGGNYFGGEGIFQFIKMDDFCVVFEAFERIL